jgi:ABC-2 type transport system permease protein
VSTAAAAALSPAVTWNGWPVPVGLSLGIVAATGAGWAGLAIAEFRRSG